MATRTTWMRKMVAAAVVVTAASAGAVAVGAVGDDSGSGPTPQAGVGSPSESVFVPINPCRIVNTQNPAGKLQVDQIRQYRMHGDTRSQGGAAACGIPRTATALELTATAVAPEGSGYLRVYPAGVGTPNATFLNYGAGQNIGNTGTVAVQPGAGVNLQVKAYGARTHVVIDVNGYYVKGLQAAVNADGTVSRANGLVQSVREATGIYRVDFDRNIRGCSYSATIGNTESGTAAMGDIVVAPNNLNVNGVFIATRNADGTPVNRPFHLIVSC